MAGRFVRTMAASLPPQWQRELRRWNFARKIKRGEFLTSEPEYQLLGTLLKSGDWAIDVGANVGHYTTRMSQLVGREGRVIAFEPVADTFATLAWNLRTSGHERNNVTLINAAVSDKCGLVGMRIPSYENGLRNFYQAEVCTTSCASELKSIAVPLDQFSFDHRISLAKIDVEGHEGSVLEGMRQLLLRDSPALIIETQSESISRKLERMGYVVTRLPGSPNLLCRMGAERGQNQTCVEYSAD